jgi:hypothetical protein
MIRVTGEGISMIGGAGFVDETDMVVSEGKDILGEVVVKLLGTAVILEILVIGEDVDNELGTKKR